MLHKGRLLNLGEDFFLKQGHTGQTCQMVLQVNGLLDLLFHTFLSVPTGRTSSSFSYLLLAFYLITSRRCRPRSHNLHFRTYDHYHP